MTKVGFTGPYADVNFGDYGMLVNNMSALALKEVTIFSYDDGFLSKLIKDYQPSLRAHVVGVHLEALPLGKGLTERPITGLEVLALIQNEDELRQAIEPLDVLVVNGGGYLNELWARPHRQTRMLQILAPALLAAEMGKRIVFSANGVGPFTTSLDSVANLLAGLPNAVLHVRDRLYSPMWARRLGIAEERIRKAPDDLFIIDKPLLERRPRLFSRGRRPYVVVETYQPVVALRNDLGRWHRFVERMDKVHGRDVIFLPLHLNGGGVDQAIVLQDELGLRWVDIREIGYLPIEDAIAILGGADLVISSRYHALVLALASGTPALSVVREVAGDLGYYYSKNAGVLRASRTSAKVREANYLVPSTAEAFDMAAGDLQELRRVQIADAAVESGVSRASLHAQRESLIKVILKGQA